MEHFTEALEHLDEATMLAFGEVGIHDVVVQEFRSRIRGNGEELIAGAVHQNGAQRADFGGDVNWHAGRYRGREGF